MRTRMSAAEGTQHISAEAEQRAPVRIAPVRHRFAQHAGPRGRRGQHPDEKSRAGGRGDVRRRRPAGNEHSVRLPSLDNAPSSPGGCTAGSRLLCGPQSAYSNLHDLSVRSGRGGGEAQVPGLRDQPGRVRPHGACALHTSAACTITSEKPFSALLAVRGAAGAHPRALRRFLMR